ncbi:MAG TPA: hypothetical protein VGR78_05425 [Verrucomicrobiae bacterium]|nr:hypothetical protein [Verrucomicrobiae bacterium]
MNAKEPHLCIQRAPFIVADPKICHGRRLTGGRIMARLILQQIERRISWDRIAREWDGRVTAPAIAETIALSHLIEKDKTFRSGVSQSKGRTI